MRSIHRYHPMARETVHALAHTERRTTESLRGLAVWMGIPTDPNPPEFKADMAL